MKLCGGAASSSVSLTTRPPARLIAGENLLLRPAMREAYSAVPGSFTRNTILVLELSSIFAARASPSSATRSWRLWASMWSHTPAPPALLKRSSAPKYRTFAASSAWTARGGSSLPPEPRTLPTRLCTMDSSTRAIMWAVFLVRSEPVCTTSIAPRPPSSLSRKRLAGSLPIISPTEPELSEVIAARRLEETFEK